MRTNEPVITEAEIFNLLNKAEETLRTLVEEGPQDSAELNMSNYIAASMQMDGVIRLMRILIEQAAQEREFHKDGPVLIQQGNESRFEKLMTRIIECTETLRVRFDTAPGLLN